MARAAQIEQALKREGLRNEVDAIEQNPATPGEVVLWCGGGHPVYSVREAVAFARTLRQEREQEIHP